MPDSAAPIIEGGAIRGRLILKTGSTLTDNEAGVDTLVRSYFAFTDEIARLRPKRGTPDSVYPTLRVSNRQITEERGLTCTLVVTSVGLVDDELPPVLIKGGWTETTIQVGTVIDHGDSSLGLLIVISDGAGNLVGQNGELINTTTESGSVNITYRAPKTSVTYLTREVPKKQMYPNYLIAEVAELTVVDIQPANYRGRPVVAQVISSESMQIDQVGSYWQVTESNAAALQSRTTAAATTTALSVKDQVKVPDAMHPLLRQITGETTGS